MKQKNRINVLSLSGVISLIFYILHDYIGGLNYPGYHRFSQAVSDLTAASAPSFMIAHGLSSVYGLFACTCSILVCILIKDKGNKMLRGGIYLYGGMNWISAVGYSLFPLSNSGYSGSFQDIIHVYVVTVLVVLTSIVSLILITIGGMKSIEYRSLAIWSGVAFLCMLFGAVGSGLVVKEYFGLVERASTYSAVTFLAILGIYGFHNFEKVKKFSNEIESLQK